MTGRIRTHWKRWLIAGAALAVVLAVAGPYVYINHVKDEAPAPLSLDAASESPDASANGSSESPASSGEQSESIDGTWQVTDGSQAGYRVDEVLFGQDTTAAGRTEQVTGDLEIEGTSILTGTVVVDLASVESDSGDRDNMFRARIMNTDQFPDATFALNAPVDLGSLPEVGDEFTARGTGDLTLRGETNSVTVDLSAQRTADGFRVSGNIPVTFADYGIEAPNFGGITVEGAGLVEFLLTLSPA